ncbi:hypothetical protein SERLA73DRAFT_176319 [Serpula lacrymans var. lacrymans S7.3]|uniref:DUF6534 domain-containing protein n=2 Tax=Serpula lacrymans var. lacrymans TaxID=341189 RepID=F8PMP0_SERL3|nr:uncharacterized protein SERLADRAFT_459152 [Serpula lacrymans var. lacrymans S7.9]EGO02872.1 hypothetical protein SERLA73DRAFT_176319 [Serpula lacrymans var. lacrymans S7.3]EGO28567.1 hypothetical protein SERLADRAFT_459152 [Serpula lacrymans var. lacrymans S7.9]
MGLFDLTLGPILMGSMMNVLLLGVMIMQSYIYFERYKNDKTWLKAVVCLLLVLDSLSAAFAMDMTYNYLVTNFANLEAIQITNLGITPYPLLTGITAFVVQNFFAWRIRLLTGNKFLAYSVCALSTVQLLASIGTMIGGIIVKYFIDLEKVKQVSLIWLLGSVVTDAIITVTLVWYLRAHRTGFASTDHLTGRIIRMTVQTGLLTTTCALGVVIAYLVSTNTTMHLAFGLPLSKLYTNSLMSSLNARKAWNPAGYTAEISGSRTGINSQFTHGRVYSAGNGFVAHVSRPTTHTLYPLPSLDSLTNLVVTFSTEPKPGRRRPDSG